MRRRLKIYLLIPVFFLTVFSVCSAQTEDEKTRSKVVFIVGEGEYHSSETMPPVAKRLKEEFNFDVTYLDAPRQGEIPRLETINDADLLVLYIRFRQPSDEQLALLKSYFDAGKPAVALRTTSHAFWGFETTKTMADVDDPEELNQIEGAMLPDRLGWFPKFFGGHYLTHPGHAEGTKSIIPASAIGHPILKGIPGQISWGYGGVYISQPLEDTAFPLILGKTGPLPAEAIAWTNEYKPGSRLFYTSLGSPENFENPAFTTLLFNAIFWALDKEIPEEGVVSANQNTVKHIKEVVLPASPALEAPEDATILFNGENLDQWQHYDLGMEPYSLELDTRAVSRVGGSDFEAARWSIEEGSVVAKPGFGDIVSKENFGHYRLHLDFLIPQEPDYVPEGFRGSSGVYLSGRYEIQIANSYGQKPNKYSLGAIFGRKAPDKNAAKPAGVWQTLEVTYQHEVDGEAVISVWLNGEVVQDNVRLKEATTFGFMEEPENGKALGMNKEVKAGPIRLQADAAQVRFANIWIEPLKKENGN